MLAGESGSRWIGTQIPYKCIIACASTNRRILFSLSAAIGCGMLYLRRLELGLVFGK